MKNRERVWRSVEKVKEILRLQWFEPVSYPGTDVAGMDWLEAAGDVRPDTSRRPLGFDRGCRQFRERQACVPPDQLSHLACSLIQLGHATYITGIRFILSRDEDIRLGYMAAEEHILSITSLTGFHLAVGSRGIQAIQCIFGNGRESRWVGCPDNAPKTKRLLFAEPITGIKAGFDVSSVFFFFFFFFSLLIV